MGMEGLPGARSPERGVNERPGEELKQREGESLKDFSVRRGFVEVVGQSGAVVQENIKPGESYEDAVARAEEIEQRLASERGNNR